MQICVFEQDLTIGEKTSAAESLVGAVPEEIIHHVCRCGRAFQSASLKSLFIFDLFYLIIFCIHLYLHELKYVFRDEHCDFFFSLFFYLF